MVRFLDEYDDADDENVTDESGVDASWNHPRDPALLRRRARLCRNKAEETEHPQLAEAFIGLAEALELAAYVSDLAAQRVLH